MKYKEWSENFLTAGRFPMPGEMKEYDYVINVSDEYISTCLDAINETPTRYFWFPLTESTDDMGIQSIFGAMQILHEAQKVGAKTLVHCHAGVNRSQTILDCYHFMMTLEHRKKPEMSIDDRISLNRIFGDEPDYRSKYDSMNNLQINCEMKRLVSLKKMEYILSCLLEYLMKDISCRSGSLDDIMNQEMYMSI